MSDTKTRAVSYRKTLALLLMFTANLFFGQVGAMAQQGLGTDDFWTTVGSAGTVDEEDLAIVDLDTFSVGHKTGKTGTVNIRYNIVAIEGANQGDCCAGRPGRPALNLPNRLLGGSLNGAHQIRVRYRDSDGHAAPTQVKFSIWRTNVFTGIDNRIFTFDSNIHGADTGIGQTATVIDCETAFDFDFDFSQFFYWIDAELTRTSPTAVARLSAIQITELNTPCSGSPPSE